MWRAIKGQFSERRSINIECWLELVEPMDGDHIEDDPIEYSLSSSGIQFKSSLLRTLLMYLER